MKIKKLGVFIKGVFIGIANLIPGVSGGTIAFVSGIYQELVEALESFFFHFSKLTSSRRKNLEFLLLVTTGVGVGIMLFAPVVDWLLNNFAASTYAFFVGIIIASVVSILIKEKITLANVFFLVGGALLGGSLLFIPSFSLGVQWYSLIFGGAAVAIATILPGISGAYLLVLFGQYDYFIEAVTIPWNYLLLFFIFTGIVIGLFLFSKLLKNFIDRYYHKALFLLSGFMVGSLPQLIDGYDFDNQFLLWSIMGLIFGGFCAILKLSNNNNFMKSKRINKPVFFIGSLLIGLGLGILIPAQTTLSDSLIITILVLSLSLGGFLVALGMLIPKEKKEATEEKNDEDTYSDSDSEEETKSY